MIKFSRFTDAMRKIVLGLLLSFGLSLTTAQATPTEDSPAMTNSNANEAALKQEPPRKEKALAVSKNHSVHLSDDELAPKLLPEHIHPVKADKSTMLVGRKL